ncbi:MAG TPA: type II secretion system F family protein [Gaiellaceae bacterium]|nr:type II secretion system F family protein [Gaiellaceae bacterium]
MLLLLLAGLSLAGAVFVVADTLTPQGRRRTASVAMVRRFSGASGSHARRRQFETTDMLDNVGRRFTTARMAERLPNRIAAAGVAGRVTPESFAAIRIGLVGLAALATIAIGTAMSLSGGMLFVVLACACVLAWVAPGWNLDRRARARRERVAEALPEALDLLAVSVEAGLGFFGAIQRLVEWSTGPLADEFALVLTDLRVGQSSEHALKRMAKRIDTPEIASFVRAIVQGEQLGISLARTLKNLADDTRKRRRAVAEERAAKAPVKMLFPAALFIFPALFIIILGPAVLTLAKYL